MGCHAQIAAAPASCTAAKANSASQTNIRIGQMNIDEAARATRKFNTTTIYGCGKGPSGPAVCLAGDDSGGGEFEIFPSVADAQAACDRENLLAVLEAIREPTQAMIDAAPGGDLATLHGAVYVWRAMIGALIEEVKNGRS